MPKTRKYLCLDSMVQEIHDCFSKVPDHRPNNREGKITLLDTLMSGFAMMHLKYPALLEFDKDRKTPELKHNLNSLYRVEGSIPCDTYMRTILDPVSPALLREPFTRLLAEVRRGGALKPYRIHFQGLLDDRYLLTLDGTGLYYSGKSRCNECCVKNKGKPNESYYHQMLAGCLAHPDLSVVLPLAPEPIVQQVGTTKNDCEKNALKRFLINTQREHPHLKLVILQDSLHADAPTIRMIKQSG